MRLDSPAPRSKEVELKLALPAFNSLNLARQLARTPVLARRHATRQQLHNIYYDTPDQVLQQARVVLRLRRAGSDAKPQWLQTFKTGDRSDSALSQRGEWEVPVPGESLSLSALKDTPWSSIDPDGTVFRALTPCFATTFERTSWLVRRRDGSVIEVAFDLGEIVAGDKRAPICELELELKAGPPAALFDIARQLARTMAVLPASLSKAERGYALAQGRLNLPLRAQPQALQPGLPWPETAQRVLRETFSQFTTNLNALCRSDDPEVVHQARVGWRRFKSARWLFKPILPADAVPSWQALQTLFAGLGQLRNLDVARTETLPPFADAYIDGDTRCEPVWQAMMQTLVKAADLERQAVRCALQEPAVGAALLATTQWLEGLSDLSGAGAAVLEPEVSLRQWSRQRILRLHRQLQRGLKDLDNPEGQHRVRILAKRMRYAIEALHTVLPQRRAKRCYRQAIRLQMDIGATRDLMQAAMLVSQLEVDRELAAFLRGAAVGTGRF